MNTRRLLWWATISGAVGAIMLSGVTVTRSGPPVEVQQLAPGLTPGSTVLGPDGRIWTVQSTETNPYPGFDPCGPNGPGADMLTALRCRDGQPFNPADRKAQGIDTPCTAGTIVYYCNSAGQKIEELGPSDAEYNQAQSHNPSVVTPALGHRWTQPKQTWDPPLPPWAAPNSWLHGIGIGVSKAWAVYGEVGNVGLGSVTYTFTVTRAGLNKSGQYVVEIYYIGSNGSSGYTTLTSG